MPESPIPQHDASNDTQEDLRPTPEPADDRQPRPTEDEPDQTGALSGTAGDGRGEEPDADRLGYRELDEERAYSERGDQSGAEDDDA